MKKGASNTSFGSVSAYIASFPPGVQKVLKEIQSTVLKAAPQGTEGISYGIPTVKLDGKVLVHFGAFQKHIGFYATPTGHTAFAARLAPYQQGKGSVQFPLSEPMPLALIADIVQHRLEVVAKKAVDKRVAAKAGHVTQPITKQQK